MFIGGGDPNYLPKLRQYYSLKGLADRVIWIDKVSHQDVAKYFSASNVAAWISHNSVTVLEAMACGVPVIIARSHMSAAVNGNGFLIEPGNAAEMHSCFTKLIESPELQKQMAGASLRLAKDKFSYSAIAQNLLQLYQFAPA